jgi:photosystem II stability/assembly factor-like uncharacterized protein
LRSDGVRRTCAAPGAFFLCLTSCILLSCAPALAQPPHWSATNGPFGGQTRAVAISPSGAFFASARLSNGRSRLYRSTDRGASFQELTAGDSISFLGPIFCTPPGVILCGASSPSGQGGIARSTDNGASWTVLPPAIHATSFAGDSNGRILCGGDVGNTAVPEAGVYLSTDKGATWENLDGDLTIALISGVAFGRDSALFIADEGYYGMDVGVFRSDDGGQHWGNVLTTPTFAMTELAVTPSGTLLVGSAGNGVMRSTNGGKNWSPVVQGAPGMTVNAFSVDSSGGIFLGSNSGVYRSTDDGASWTAASSGLPALQVWDVAAGAGTLRLAGDAIGVSESTDGGESWHGASRGIRATVCKAICVGPTGTLLVTTDAVGGLFRSTDEGTSWSPTGGNTFANRLVYCIASSQDGTLFAGVQGDGTGTAVYRSTDQGASWEGTSSLMPNLPAISLATRGEGEVVAVSNAGSAATGVFRSTDNGVTWTALTTGYSNLTFWSVTLPRDGTIVVGFYGGVVISPDTGKSWNTVAYGLPSSIVNGLASTSDGKVFATTSGFGNYYLASDIAGPGWAPADSGLPRQDIGGMVSLGTDTSGGLYGVTVNDGVWQIPRGPVIWNRYGEGLIDTSLMGVAISPHGAAFVTTAGEGVFSTALRSQIYALTTFEAAREEARAVRLMWSAADGGLLLGYQPERRSQDTSLFSAVVPSIVPVDTSAGSTHDYIFTDTTASPNAESYRLRLVAVDGSEHYSDTITAAPFTSVVAPAQPPRWTLERNYPNPFNAMTVIRGQWTEDSRVRLAVYDVLGREVAVLADGRYPAGKYLFTFDGRNLASGVYFYRLTAGSRELVRSMVLLK